MGLFGPKMVRLDAEYEVDAKYLLDIQNIFRFADVEIKKLFKEIDSKTEVREILDMSIVSLMLLGKVLDYGWTAWDANKLEEEFNNILDNRKFLRLVNQLQIEGDEIEDSIIYTALSEYVLFAKDMADQGKRRLLTKLDKKYAINCWKEFEQITNDDSDEEDEK